MWQFLKPVPIAEKIGLLIPGAIFLAAIYVLLREFPALQPSHLDAVWAEVDASAKLFILLVVAFLVGLALHWCSRILNRLLYDRLYPRSSDPLFEAAYKVVEPKKPGIKASSVYSVCKQAIDSGDPKAGTIISIHEGLEKFCRTLSLCLIFAIIFFAMVQFWTETILSVIMLLVFLISHINLRRRAGGRVYQLCPHYKDKI